MGCPHIADKIVCLLYREVSAIWGVPLKRTKLCVLYREVCAIWGVR